MDPTTTRVHISIFANDPTLEERRDGRGVSVWANLTVTFQLTQSNHSKRSASIGFIRAALRAG
jgi:hypothetical protein